MFLINAYDTPLTSVTRDGVSINDNFLTTPMIFVTIHDNVCDTPLSRVTAHANVRATSLISVTVTNMCNNFCHSCLFTCNECADILTYI